MRLLSTPTEIKDTFIDLINDCEEFSGAVAWASFSHDASQELYSNKDKITKLIVGLHFYQTQPLFIEKFLYTRTVEYIKKTSGVFHPKFFLFRKGSEIVILIGSANFTNHAFLKNDEAVVQINVEDGSELLDKFLDLLHSYWDESENFDEKELKDYAKIASVHRDKLKSLADDYGDENQSKKSIPLFKVGEINYSWDEYITALKENSDNSLNHRLKILEKSNEFFNSYSNFKKFPDNVRDAVASTFSPTSGISPLGDNLDWGFFGGMSGSGKFNNVIKSNSSYIAKALDKIPLDGKVTRDDYCRFIDEFSKCLSDKIYIGPASRLLAMKRPDYFVCVDGKNKRRLYKAVGIPVTLKGYEHYWEELILRIQNTDWWNHKNPKNEIERRIKANQVALLDALYYDR